MGQSTIEQKNWHDGNYIFVTMVVLKKKNGAYSQIGYPFLDKKLKDFVSAIFQI
jgi:hypothetical protein